MTLPFAAVYPIVVLYRARLRRTGSLSSVASACATWAVAACMLAGIVNSFSRMGFIATLCSLLVAALLIVQGPRYSNARSRLRRSLAAGMLGGVALSAFILLPPSGLVRRFADLDAGKFTGDGRTALWAEAVSVIRDYKVFGCGLYAYEMAVPPYKLPETIGIVSFAHNDYLQGTAELGGLGFLIVGLLAASIVRSAIRPVVNSFDPESACFAVACAAAIVAILLHSLVDFNLYVPANASLLAWIAGMTVGNQLSSVGFQQLSPERRSWTRQAHA
jgi:O-antigen ligase